MKTTAERGENRAASAGRMNDSIGGSIISDTAYVATLANKGQELNDNIGKNMKDFKGIKEVQEKIE